MASVPTFETLLIEIRKSFGLPLPKERNKFTQFKASEQSHRAQFANFKNDLVENLNLIPRDALALESQMQDWSAMSLKLGQSIWGGLVSQPQLLWLLATHIYIPCFARLVAFWQHEEIMDEGMPAHRFWYLPEEINGELQLPMTQVWNWLEDLVFDPSNNLEKQIYGAETADSTSVRLGISKEHFNRTLLNWKKATGKETASLIKTYFADDLKIEFKGTVEHDKNKSLEESFIHAINILKEKGYTGKTLYPEIQLENEKVVGEILAGDCSEDLKKRFLNLIYIRFSRPSNQKIIFLFSIAQACQNAYVRFGRLIEGKTFNSTNSNPNENKLIQIISIFKCIYNLSYDTTSSANSPKIDDTSQDQVFYDRIPEQYRLTIFQALCSGVATDGFTEAIGNINNIIRSLDSEHIPDILSYKSISEFGISPQYLLLYKQNSLVREGLKKYECEASLNKKIEYVQKENHPIILTSIGTNASFPQCVRQAAFYRLDELDLTPKRRLEGYIGQLAVLLNNKTKFDRPHYVESIVSNILKNAKELPKYESVKSDFIQFEAKHELSKGNVELAGKLFKNALELPNQMSVASNRGEIARDLFALRAANKKSGYSLNNQESLYRDMKYFGGFDLDDPISPLAALYWTEKDSLFNPSKFYPTLEVAEELVAEYYPELYQSYPVNK